MQVFLCSGGAQEGKKTNYNGFAPRGVQRNLEGLISNPVLRCKACDVLTRSNKVTTIFIG